MTKSRTEGIQLAAADGGLQPDIGRRVGSPPSRNGWAVDVNGTLDGRMDAPKEGAAGFSHECGAYVPCPRCGAHLEVSNIRVSVAVRRSVEAPRPSAPVLEVPLDTEDSLSEVVSEVKRRLVLRSLRRADGVKTRAAEIVGMKYTTFYSLVERLGITDEEVFGTDNGA